MTQSSDSAGGSDRPGDRDPIPEWATIDPNPDDEPSAYHGTEVLPPPIHTTGRYQYGMPRSPARPPDPVSPFVAPPVNRRRRSEWPVLVVALVISSLVLAACCIAGYMLYASKGSPLPF
jgi:hypothetical protein